MMSDDVWVVMLSFVCTSTNTILVHFALLYAIICQVVNIRRKYQCPESSLHRKL